MTKASFSSAVSSSFPETICYYSSSSSSSSSSSTAGSLSVSAFSVASCATAFGPDQEETQTTLGVARNDAFLRPDELPLFSSVLSESVLSASTLVPSTFGDTPKASTSPFAADAATTRRSADLLLEHKTASAASSSLLPPDHLYYYDPHKRAVDSQQHDEVGTAFQQSGEENEEEEKGQRTAMQQVRDRLKGHSCRYQAAAAAAAGAGAASPTRAHKAFFRQNKEEALHLFSDSNDDAPDANDRIAALLADEELPAQQGESRREEEEEITALESFRLQLQKVIQITSRGLSLQKAIAIVMSDSSTFTPPSFLHSASSATSRTLSSAPLPTSSPFRSSCPLFLKPPPPAAASASPQSTLLEPRVSGFEANGHSEPLLSDSRDSQVGDVALPASTFPLRCLSSPFSSGPISSGPSAIASFFTAPSTQDRFRRRILPHSSPTSSSSSSSCCCPPLLPLCAPNNGSNVILSHSASVPPTLSKAALSKPQSPFKADPLPCSLSQRGEKKHIPTLCSVPHSFSASSFHAPSLSLQATSFQNDRAQLSPGRRKKQHHVSPDSSSTLAVTSSASPPEQKHAYCSHSMSTDGASSATLPAPLPQLSSSSFCSSPPLPTTLVAPPNSSVLPSSSSFSLSKPDNSSYPIDISPFQIKLNLNFLPPTSSCSAADSRSSTHGLTPPPTVRVRVLDGDCDIRSSAANVSFLYPQATHLTAVVEDGPETLAVVRVRVLEEA